MKKEREKMRNKGKENVLDLIPDYGFIIEYYRKNRPAQKDGSNIEAVTELITSWIHYEKPYKKENIEDTFKDIETDALSWAYANKRRFERFERSLKKVCEIADIKDVPKILVN